MRRGAGKAKTENEKDAAPEDEETATQGNGDTVASASGGESDKEDKSTAATAKKRKGKRGKKEESSTNSGDEAQNTEPAEKKAKRATRTVKNSTEGATEDQAEEYEVEKIVDMKESRGKRLFKIQWKGYGPESDTWEEEQDLSCPDLIKEFVSQLPNKGKKRNAKSTNNKAKKLKVSFGEAKEADQKEYEVAQVMEMHRKKNGKREFLVHWKGFSHDEDTWEPEENLNCEELIEEFMKKNKTSNAKAERKGAARASGKGKKGARRSNSKQKAAQNSE